jgi:hypothetical protein
MCQYFLNYVGVNNAGYYCHFMLLISLVSYFRFTSFPEMVSDVGLIYIQAHSGHIMLCIRLALLCPDCVKTQNAITQLRLM